MATQFVTPALLRIKSVCVLVGLSRAQIYRLVRSGEFPPPVRLSTKSVAWPSEHVNAWISQKINPSQG
ncbi:helix-turn-helix transcriptional regulator [Pseudomonas sp. NPDC079086]|uniref:helix-turn-helix transcriptional regulator n=1 Tax=unclassified Pseudomonas TaxID=196821 RepID=UPI0037C5B606